MAEHRLLTVKVEMLKNGKSARTKLRKFCGTDTIHAFILSPLQKVLFTVSTVEMKVLNFLLSKHIVK